MKKIYVLMLAGLLFGGCNDFADDINVNPNKPSVASGTQLIANAEFYLPGLNSAPQGEFFSQHLAETLYPGASLYNTVNFNYYGLYSGPLMNLETVLNTDDLDAKEGPVNNQLAVAKILKAYFFWNITDRWGDVPYSEALKGDDNFTPKYDTQEAIYNNLFQLLEEANSMVVPGKISNDIVYGGDAGKWQKLANTLRLLMALRLSEVDATKAQAEFNKALEAGTMTSNGDNFVYKHLPEEVNENYWYSQVGRQKRLWWALSENLVDHMKPVEDPRLPVFGNKNEEGYYVGLEYGKAEASNESKYSLLGTAIWKQDAPVYLVTYAQVLFAKAEAAKRGWIPGGDVAAADFYKEAISLSVLQWTGTTTGVSELLTQPGVAFEPAKAIEQIATQRWIHLFMNGYEAWAEWRRTGYPDLSAASGGKQVPTRQGYPTEEQFNNTANYNEAVQRQFGGTDGLYGQLWWDK
ncbi:SusD/RagB family nutrient-binding outer membrane lipoprotein [Pontibacter flavimaris]|uniref:SusD/RagB family nutrient-binding outer membrane lipoprotein n=1 Tax=Pontibacter flavimaris TaxID=1797110 RepID=A0A1Q5PDU6_9BACT|nr:SusD/RagB family nutrient-binding outer membrane lipoprotein [Pontibacter flavimaris]OKL40396.1 hypothetical protein A3841_18980 [Pontibacter flavimaris]